MNKCEANDRLSDRHEMLLQARCRQSPWRVFDVELGNLSAGGCTIIGGKETFSVGQMLTLRIPSLKPLACRVTWRRNGVVGVEFASALADTIIAVLNARYGLAIDCHQAQRGRRHEAC